MQQAGAAWGKIARRKRVFMTSRQPCRRMMREHSGVNAPMDRWRAFIHTRLESVAGQKGRSSSINFISSGALARPLTKLNGGGTMRR